MNKVQRHEGIACHLPPASRMCPGLDKSKGKPRKCKDSAKPGAGERESLGETAPSSSQATRPNHCPAPATSALPQNTKTADDHEGGDFMQLQNALMRRGRNVKFCKEPLQIIKPLYFSGEIQGKGVKRNGHRTRARERGRKGNKNHHHHHHHQDTTTGRETERFPWAVPRGKGATVSVKYKTQCPPAGGDSRRWDWFGIPLG